MRDSTFDQKSLLYRFQKNLAQKGFFKKAPKILIACSGGADSIALFHLIRLSLKKTKMAVIHFNHGIRKKTAKRDELFVQKICLKHSIPFFVGHAKLSEKQNRKKLSLEEAARLKRYDFFKKIYKKQRANIIFLAHHRDDQAETVLMRVCQGTGMRGLLGIRETIGMNGMRIARPLLYFSKLEMRDFLKENHFSFCEDETNQRVDYLRNRVRLEVLPFLKKKINPKVGEALARLPQIMEVENNLIEELEVKAVTRVLKSVSQSKIILKAVIFRSLHPALQFRILDKFLKKLDPAAGILFEHAALLQNQLGKSQMHISLPRKLEIRGNLSQIWVQRGPSKF